jgi:hypothetical protein
VNADHTFHKSTPFNAQGGYNSAGDNSAFSWSTTTISIAFWYSIFSVYLMDGSSLSIPGQGSSGSPWASITGLSPGSSYYIYCYYGLASQDIFITISDQNGGKSPCSMAQLIQTFERDGYIFLWATIIATPSGGTGSGGGTPGGGACFDGATVIETDQGLQRFDEVPEYFTVRTKRGMRPAQLIRHEPRERIVTTMPAGSLVTPDHVVEVCEGCWVPAGTEFRRRRAHRDELFNLRVLTDDPEAHNYYLPKEGVFAHNTMKIPTT